MESFSHKLSRLSFQILSLIVRKEYVASELTEDMPKHTIYVSALWTTAWEGQKLREMWNHSTKHQIRKIILNKITISVNVKKEICINWIAITISIKSSSTIGLRFVLKEEWYIEFSRTSIKTLQKYELAITG